MSCEHDQMAMCPDCRPSGFQTKDPLTFRKDGAESFGERGICKSCGALCFGFVCQRCELNVVRSDRDRYKAALEELIRYVEMPGSVSSLLVRSICTTALTPSKDGGE